MMSNIFSSCKGFNQIDFAVGVSLIILMMSITVSYLTTTIVTPISTYSSSELRNKAENLNDVIFKTEGIPSKWQWKNTSVRPSLGTPFFKRTVHLSEYNGTDNSNRNVKIYVELDENAYHGSLVVYEGNKTLETNLTSMVDSDNDGFLEETYVIFNINVSANSEKTVDLYYSQENDTSFEYSNLEEDDNTLNKTVFSERRIMGISRQKLNSMYGMVYSTVKDKFDMERNFHLKIENDTSTLWEFGRRKDGGEYLGLPNETDVVLYPDNYIYQYKNGEIDNIKATTAVW
ncbi:MAG: hypothetical protein ABEK36_01910 [Candidatus Aenigmatarchaeota archaeon]